MQVNLLASETSITLSEAVFDRALNEDLIHQLVTGKMAGDRQGTKAQKTRGEVSGSTAKVRQQKGSGRARAGSVKNPLWYHGGVVFAAKPRDFSQKLNKKMYRAGMASILSHLLREARLKFIEPLRLEVPKTKALMAYLAGLGVEKNSLVLFVDCAPSDALCLSARNRYNLAVCAPHALDPADLLRADLILMTPDAAHHLGERLQ